MAVSKLWYKKTNPETGEMLEFNQKYLRWSDNGTADFDALMDTPYGEQLAINLDRRWRYGYFHDAVDPVTLAFYEGLGVKKELFENEHFYSRWVLLTPLEMYMEYGKNKKYPLIFVNHGGAAALELEEYLTGFNTLAGREGFMAVYPQNTNPDNLERILDEIEERYPVDRERVYITGYSQGGYQTNAALMRMPERFAAAAPCGIEVYQEKNSQGHIFSQEELARVKKVFVPYMQVFGACEHTNIIPYYKWAPKTPRSDTRVFGDACRDPRKETMIKDTLLGKVSSNPYDVTDPEIKQETDPVPNPILRPAPPEGCDTAVWKIGQLNKRLELLGCAPRKVETCLQYRDNPQDELHHTMGFYGDREEIREYWGVRHYIIDIKNGDGITAFRYIAAGNSPHTSQATLGQLVWDFFKQYKRDIKTGKIVVEPYQYEDSRYLF